MQNEPIYHYILDFITFSNDIIFYSMVRLAEARLFASLFVVVFPRTKFMQHTMKEKWKAINTDFHSDFPLKLLFS